MIIIVTDCHTCLEEVIFKITMYDTDGYEINEKEMLIKWLQEVNCFHYFRAIEVHGTGVIDSLLQIPLFQVHQLSGSDKEKAKLVGV